MPHEQPPEPARRREQAVVTDPLETGRQDVLQKAVDELGSRHAQRALLAAGGIGADTQQHVVAVDAENPLVADRHSVRVAAVGLERRFGTTEFNFVLGSTFLAGICYDLGQ